MAGRQVEPIFTEVSGFLNMSELCSPHQMDKILTQFTEQGVSVQINDRRKKLCIVGDLAQLIKFEEKVRQAKKGDLDDKEKQDNAPAIVFHNIDQKAYYLLLDVLAGKIMPAAIPEKRKRCLKNETYKLMPFLLTLAKNYNHVFKRKQNVSIQRKASTKDTDTDEIRIGFTGEEMETNELIKDIKEMYDREKTVESFCLNTRGSQNLMKSVVSECGPKFKPTLLVVKDDNVYAAIPEESHAEFKKWMKGVQADPSDEMETVLQKYVDGNIDKRRSSSSVKLDEPRQGYNFADSPRIGQGKSYTLPDSETGTPDQLIDYGQFDKSAEPEKLVLDVDTVSYIHQFCTERIKTLEKTLKVNIDFSEQAKDTICVRNLSGQPVEEWALEDIGGIMQDIFSDLIRTDIHTIQNQKQRYLIMSICKTNKVLLIERDSGVQIMGFKEHISKTSNEIGSFVGHIRTSERKLVRSASDSESSSSSPEMATNGNHQAFSQTVNPAFPPHGPVLPAAYQHNKTKLQIKTSLGDITKLEVDAIVNAANSDLHHIGGQAMAIALAGGPIIQKESDDYIRKNRSLDFGKVCVTSAGKLLCKRVFHVVGPRYSEYKSTKDCADILMRTFTAVIEKAGKLKLASIAIPSVSSGIYGVPPYLVADCVTQSIDQYLRKAKTTSLKVIHLIDIQSDMVRLLQKQMESLVETGEYCTYQPEAAKGAIPKHHDITGAKERPGSTGSTTSAKPTRSDSSERVSSAKGNKGASRHGRDMDDPSSFSTQSLPSERNMLTNGDGNAAAAATSAVTSQPSASGGQEKTPIANQAVANEEEKCCICMCEITKPKTLKCRHTFCSDCIERGFEVKPACPICGAIYGKITGNQPKDGKMSHSFEKYIILPGYEKCGAIVITYSFPSGKQTKEHEHPGKPYRGTGRRAYLPDNKEGRHVLKLLKEAFDARLVFTVGSSRTTGLTDTVTWNDIHHKTNTTGGPERFGYPDKTYLNRVQEELAAKGIK